MGTSSDKNLLLTCAPERISIDSHETCRSWWVEKEEDVGSGGPMLLLMMMMFTLLTKVAFEVIVVNKLVWFVQSKCVWPLRTSKVEDVISFLCI